MSSSEFELLSAEDKQKAEDGLMAAADEFMKNQSDKKGGSGGSDMDIEEESEPDARKKKVRNPKANNDKSKNNKPSNNKSNKTTEKVQSKKRVAMKDVLFEVKAAVCNEVRKHPEIYQITHKGYHDKPLKDASWNQISEAVSIAIGEEISVEKCQKHWRALTESTRYINIYIMKFEIIFLIERF